MSFLRPNVIKYTQKRGKLPFSTISLEIIRYNVQLQYHISLCKNCHIFGHFYKLN